MGQQLGQSDQSRNRVVIGITITNSVDSVNYLEYNLSDKMQHGWISHSDLIDKKITPVPPFSLEIKLLDDDLLETALQKANPNKEDEEPNWLPNALDSDMVGPGFPSIMVGPNAGGKSVALNMIDTFHQLLAPLADCIGSMVVEFVPAAFMDGELAYGVKFDSDVMHSVSQSLCQWKWLGPAWSVKLDFAEYQSNPVWDDQVDERHHPLVDIEYFSTLMEFRSADDLDQIRLTIESEGRRKRRLYIHADKYAFSSDLDIEGYDIGDISSISVIPSTAYRLLSGVGDNFLPITIIDNGELRTHTSSKLKAMFVALETALEVYYESPAVDDDDLDVGDIFRSQPCNWGSLEAWNDVLDEGKYEDIQNEVKSCFNILRMEIRESGEDIRGFPRTLRIDTLRKSPSSEVLLTPTQNAVVEICTALDKVWKRTLHRMSIMSPRKTDYAHADFEEFKHLVRFGWQDMSKWISDNPKKGFPNPKKGESLFPYWFPDLQAPYFGTEYAGYPPFDPSGNLKDDIRSHTPFPSNLPLGLIRDNPLSLLYKVARRWSKDGVDLKELIDAHELLENSDFDTAGDDRAFTDLFAKIKESFGEENGVKDVDDVMFSVFNHTARCLGEYAEIAGKLDILSEKVSEYLGIIVKVQPVRVANLKEILEDPAEIDRIAGEMNLPYLSSGQAQLLTMLTQMELASPETRIILLDEPELSLHDKLIGDLYDYLCEFSKNNNKQIICSTHSTTLAGLGLRHTAFVDRIGGNFEWE